MSRIRRIAVLTSGGGCPGSNACIRAVVRMSLHFGWEAWGVRRGYAGLLVGDLTPLTSRSVSHVIDRGGTFLGSSRCDDFRTRVGIREALRHLNEDAIDALVVIGGDGSLRGARELSEAGAQVVGVPGTIENDIGGTDIAIGVDTALNSALDAIDRIKDTASSQEQAFLVEVAGRQSGYLALMAGIAGGAEMVCVPDMSFGLDDVVREIGEAYVRGKQHCIVVVAEGVQPSATLIAERLSGRRTEIGFGIRLSVLSHVQRGGSPTAKDRLLATKLGAAAVERIKQGETGTMVGVVNGELATTDLAEATSASRGIDIRDFELAAMLAQ